MPNIPLSYQENGDTTPPGAIHTHQEKKTCQQRDQKIENAHLQHLPSAAAAAAVTVTAAAAVAAAPPPASGNCTPSNIPPHVLYENVSDDEICMEKHALSEPDEGGDTEGSQPELITPIPNAKQPTSSHEQVKVKARSKRARTQVKRVKDCSAGGKRLAKMGGGAKVVENLLPAVNVSENDGESGNGSRDEANEDGGTIRVASSALAKIASATIMKGSIKSTLWSLDLSDTMSLLVRPCRFQHSSRYVQIKETSEEGFSRVVNVSDYNFVKVFNNTEKRIEMSANQHRILTSSCMIFYRHGRAHFTISMEEVKKINDNYAQILMRLLPNLNPFNEAAMETESHLELEQKRSRGELHKSTPQIKSEPLTEEEQAKGRSLKKSVNSPILI